MDLDFELDANTLLEHLKRVPSYASIKIQKDILQPDNEDDAFKIWRLVYNIEFLTPKVADNTKKSQYRYVRPFEDNSLVSMSRWNDIQKHIWDIHPCYRVFLIHEKENKEKALLFQNKNKNSKGKKVRKRR